jgi:hypothetical protein
VVKVLLAELEAPDVILGVFGARRIPSGKRPAGSNVLELLTETSKPVVVVPPEICPGGRRPLRRFLLPLDATEAAARIASIVLDRLTSSDSETVVLHVFDDQTRAPILNHRGDDLSEWGVEFLLCHLPGQPARFEWRTGYPPAVIVNVSKDEDVDMVVVSWSQVLEGHGDIIQTLLSRCRVPILVSPTTLGKEQS